MTRGGAALGRWLVLGALALAAGCAPKAPPPPPAAPAPPPAPAAEVNVPTPSLLDLTVTDLRARFGEPHQSRRDGGAEVWNYEVPDLCRLNLVLQRMGRTQKVVHAQARLEPGATEADCLHRLSR